MTSNDIKNLTQDDLQFIEAYFTWKSGKAGKNNEIEKLKWFYDVGYQEGTDFGSSFCSS